MRDQAQSEPDGKDGLLNRRDYLTAAGLVGLAAVGGVGTGAARSTEYEEGLLIDASADGGACDFAVECDGAATRVRTLASVDDSIDAGAVEGRIEDGVAAYKLTGAVTGFSVDGAATVEYGPDVLSKLPAPVHTIEIESPGAIDYEFSTTGEVTKRFDDGRMSAEAGNDAITRHDDGTCTVRGFTGDGYGDAYTFEGEITEFAPFEGDFTIRVDGTETTVADLTGQRAPASEIVLSTPNEVNYEFTTSGEASKILDNGDLGAEALNDSITHHDDGTCTVRGFTGNPGYGDSYEFEGEITDFSPLREDVYAQVDGERMTTYELMGVKPPADGGSDTGGSGDGSSSAPAIGGGDGYGNTVPPSAATVTVASLSGLRSALADAGDGDVVYVDGSATIDMDTAELTIPSGVTLASDRGVNGASGALLRTDENPWWMFSANEGARVTGLRVGGPKWDWVSIDAPGELGISAEGANVEIDNCEVYGFGYAAVRTADDTHVHHCHVHHNAKDGTGYGVSTGGSENPIVEYNRFDHNRHSVASSDGGYTARYNYVGDGAISHVFDQHRPGGDTITIHHNTVAVVENAWKSKKAPAVAIRGVPDNVADVHHNWFHNPEPPRDSPSGWTDEAVIQVHVDGWRNVDLHNNHYGSDEPGTDVGHPR